ncbi:MAG TPA: response regulator [Bryobacteraceae bacterium]|nr:response regulator [Bryobacteraceae bacterium]
MRENSPLLVIEDSDDDFAILATCLKSVGVSNRLIRCASGEETRTFLQTIDSLPLAQRPCFVFIDLNLPGTHGSEVLKELKAHAILAPIPAVVLTTSSRPSDVDEAYKNGAAGFLSKPIDLENFEKMVQQVAEYWFACVKLPTAATHA